MEGAPDLIIENNFWSVLLPGVGSRSGNDKEEIVCFHRCDFREGARSGHALLFFVASLLVGSHSGLDVAHKKTLGDVPRVLDSLGIGYASKGATNSLEVVKKVLLPVRRTRKTI